MDPDNLKATWWEKDSIFYHERIPYQNDRDKENARYGTQMDIRGGNLKSPIGIKAKNVLSSSTGRFPANLLVSDNMLNDGSVTKSPGDYARGSNSENQNSYSKGIGGTKGDIAHNFGDSGSFSRYFDLDAWWDERIKHLPKEAQKTFPFLIIPKASKSEKNGSKHPTIKPVKLFSWLMTIGSRKGDLILDPFLGSGTILDAGYLTNRDVMGFEIDPQWEYLYSQRAHKFQGNLGDWL